MQIKICDIGQAGLGFRSLGRDLWSFLGQRVQVETLRKKVRGWGSGLGLAGIMRLAECSL